MSVRPTNVTTMRELDCGCGEMIFLNLCKSLLQSSFTATLTSGSSFGEERPSRFLTDIPSECITYAILVVHTHNPA